MWQGTAWCRRGAASPIEALKRVSQAVYGTTKADWRTVIADSDIFDADDKRFLDLDDYDEDDEFA